MTSIRSTNSWNRSVQSAPNQRRDTVPFFDLRRQLAPLCDEISLAWRDILETASFTGGPSVRLFEEEFGRFVGVEHAVGVANGTDALQLALVALGIGPGDEVITVPHTFVATVEAILHAGATPVFVDVDRVTGTMNPAAIEDAVTDRTKALLPVHLYGQPADLDPLVAIARRLGLALVEDACQAHGADYRGRTVGTFGDAAAFSFYPSKNLGAAGDGGAVTTRDAELADRIRALREHGQLAKDVHELPGFTSRLDATQAAVLFIKLHHLTEWNEQRRTVAGIYQNRLAPSGVQLPVEAPGRRHVFHLYPIRVSDRDTVRTELRERGIGTGAHYPVPVHLQPGYRRLGYPEGSFPEAESWAAEVVTLPMFPELTIDEIDRVAEVLADTLEAGYVRT